MNEKDRRLADFCARRNLDGVWLRRRANVAWLTEGADVHVLDSSELGVASILWTPAKKQVLTDSIEAPRMRAEEFGSEWELVERPWYEPFRPPTGNFASDWPDDSIAELRFSLVPLEVERVRELGRECAEQMRALLHTVQRGATELEVGAALGARLLRRGIRSPVILIAADERIARFRHPIPTAKKVERTLMTVLCAERRGLIVCMTRLVHFGELSTELAKKHAAVVAVDNALHRATRPGAIWGDVFAEAQRVYRETGFADEWKLHHQGGPMGYQARDFCVAPGDRRSVVANQLVGWNPSISGTKSEDTILSSGEVLTAMSDWPTLDGRPDILRRAN